MEHAAHALLPVLILLLAAIIGAGIMKLLRLTPIIGFFIAGAIVGPYALNLVEESEMITLLAEIGVVLLLFDIGLHLSFRQMWRLRHNLFVMGPLQVAASSLVIGLIIWKFGYSWQIATITGLGLSLSSTAIIMQMLGEKEQTKTLLGQTITSILVFQDMFIVFLLMLVPVLAGSGDTSIAAAMGIALAKIAGALIGVYVVGKYILQPLLRTLIGFAREELFTAAILLIILATASFTGMIGLSLPLGAFLAGLIISETEYCYMVKAEIKPFRTLLLGLFFISVGMSLNLTFFINEIGMIALLVVGLMGVKCISLIGVALLQKRSIIASCQMGLWLAQAGEFGFVLFGMAYKETLIDEELYQYIMVVIGASFVLTPVLIMLSDKIALHFVPDGKDDNLDARSKVVIFGFGAEGRNIACILHSAGVKYIGVDASHNRISMARNQGFDVTHGDIASDALYDSLAIEEASAVVLALDNDANIKKLVKRMHSYHVDATVFANVIDASNMAELKEAGIVCIANDPGQSCAESARKILEYFDTNPDEIDAAIQAMFAAHEEEL